MDNPLPTSNLSVSAVRNALGVSTTNVGALCTSPNINMWSKRKPVRDSRIDIPYGDTGKGSDGMCGLLLPPWEGDDTLLTHYAKPRGAGGQYSEPYRLGDFRGYFDDRTLPITILPPPDSIVISTQDGTGYLSDVYTTPAINDPVVTIEDMGMQVCSFYYRKFFGDTFFVGWSPTLFFNFGGPGEQYVDVKFGLIPIEQASSLDNWYKELPGSGINIYELPRENTTQNKNWLNIPTELTGFIVKSWWMGVRWDLGELQYSILATYSFNATIVVKERTYDTTILQFYVPVTANVPINNSIPLEGYDALGNYYRIELYKSYMGYIYDGATLKDSEIIAS